MQEFVTKFVLALAGLAVVSQLVSPLLTPVVPPLGSVIVALIYLGTLAWLVGFYKV